MATHLTQRRRRRGAAGARRGAAGTGGSGVGARAAGPSRRARSLDAGGGAERAEPERGIGAGASSARGLQSLGGGRDALRLGLGGGSGVPPGAGTKYCRPGPAARRRSLRPDSSSSDPATRDQSGRCALASGSWVVDLRLWDALWDRPVQTQSPLRLRGPRGEQSGSAARSAPGRQNELGDNPRQRHRVAVRDHLDLRRRCVSPHQAHTFRPRQLPGHR